MGGGVELSKLYFYTNYEPNEKMFKNPTFLFEKEVDVMRGSNVENPTFIVSGKEIDISRINYVYSDKFKRYYFCTITTMPNNMYAIECEVDALQSFNREICSNEYLIERQEFEYNNMLVDEKIRSRVGTVTEKKVIGNIGKSISYVLTVTGGSE